MHTNDAVGAITRMRDMRVEPFLLASTLRAVIAQRLVRRLCQHCHEAVQADKSASALLGFDPGTIIYRALGCDACSGTGYKGRIGVFRSEEHTSELQSLMRLSYAVFCLKKNNT